MSVRRGQVARSWWSNDGGCVRVSTHGGYLMDAGFGGGVCVGSW